MLVNTAPVVDHTAPADPADDYVREYQYDGRFPRVNLLLVRYSSAAAELQQLPNMKNFLTSGCQAHIFSLDSAEGYRALQSTAPSDGGTAHNNYVAGP